MSGLIKVKRDGPRGWHWVDPKNFDPVRNQLFDPPKQDEPTPPRRGRTPNK